MGVNGIPIRRARGADEPRQSICIEPSFPNVVHLTLPVERDDEQKISVDIEYEYENYSDACFITNKMKYLTRHYSEAYTIIGNWSREHMIHGFAYNAFREERGAPYPVERTSDASIWIEFTQWLPPGAGTAVIVRRRSE